jgi:DnaJ-class molecular chaperone
MKDCPHCHGRGEVAVPGTSGANVGPEALETVPCYVCAGTGEVTPAVDARYHREREAWEEA